MTTLAFLSGVGAGWLLCAASVVVDSLRYVVDALLGRSECAS